MDTRDHSYSTGFNLWFTNIDLPDGWKARPPRSRMNPGKCLMEGCYITPNKYNGNDYIGPRSSVMGTRSKVTDLFHFEMEQLKGIPRSYTRIEMSYTNRRELITRAWDMNVASKFLRHLGRETPVAMEQCNTINGANYRQEGRQQCLQN